MARYLLVTGKLACRALEKVVAGLELPGGWVIKVLPRPVAALMTTEYISRHLRGVREETGAEIIIIPGLCQGPLECITAATGCQVLRGPADLEDLPACLIGYKTPGAIHAPPAEEAGPGPRLKILAEIVAAPGLALPQIVERARYYRQGGADIIDIGCDVDQSFPHLGEAVRALKAEGFTVSVDSHWAEDIRDANKAGVDLVLSLNSENLELAKELECPAVIIPDEGMGLPSLYRNIEQMERWGLPYVIDPILPPLTLGLAEGISRYVEVRKRFPDRATLMGLGNVTELVDADSTGINALLVGLATELNIDYVLTTEVSHRAAGAVKEVDLARRLMQRALAQGRLPKHLDDGLLTIKDPRGNLFTETELREMHAQIKDKNFRIFVAGRYIYVFNNRLFLRGTSAEELFARLPVTDPAHAFYLGRELDKAELAARLGKRYRQDFPLRWGYMNADAAGERDQR